MTTKEQQAFDQMRDALEVLNHLDADINFLNTNELEEMVDKALSAAKAVSEPKLGAAVAELASTEYDQLRAKVQPQARGEVSWNLRYADSTPKLNVGHSAFEDWFQQQPFATQIGVKQMCRDAYAAGMGDPLVTYAHPQASEPAWMPIETAPKNGDFLLAVWEGDWNNPKQRLAVYQARGWAKGGPTWAMKGNYRTEEGGAYSLAGWMPLPAAPEATK